MRQDKEYTSRSHPHRLPAEDYRRPGQLCHVAMARRAVALSLIDEDVPGLLVGALDESADRHGCEVIAYCIMPDHLHLLVRVGPHGGDIEAFLHSFKSWTGRELTRRAGGVQVWQRSFHDRHARCRRGLAAAVAYIMMNPVRAGLCRTPEEWPFSEFRLETRGRGRSQAEA